jgi:oxygen-dependent protoporphyrinogen oxidase
MSDFETDTLVIGAGISGLSAAHALLRAGRGVLVAEAAGRAGGNIRSRHEAGFILEDGPNTVAASHAELWRHFEELGVAGELVEAERRGARRYVLRGGEPVALPASPPALVRSPLLSARAKLRLLAEPLVPHARHDESVAAFFARRLGAEPVAALVDPFVSGVFAGDPAALSMRAAFPRLWELEQRHGSLLRGMLAGRRRRGPRPRRAIISFRKGLETWPLALARALGERLWLSAPVRALRRGDAGWEATVERAGAPARVRARTVVLATPAHAAAQLLQQPEARALAAIPYPSVSVVHLGYRREDVAHPLDGFGLLVPAREGRALLGSLWPAALFPERAPEGQVLTTNFVGGARRPELAMDDDEGLIARTHAELVALLGVRGQPVIARVARWPLAIPQYVAGHSERVDALAQLERRLPGLHLLANYRGGIGVEACWLNGTHLAEAINNE